MFNIKKITILLSLVPLFAFPLFASASIDVNLYYDVHNKPQVQELQEFLISHNFMTAQATGNFYSLTLIGVKQYQTSNGIPSTGYVGTLTRASINSQLTSELSDSNQQSINETGSLPVVPVLTPTVVPVQPNPPVDVQPVSQIPEQPTPTPVVISAPTPTINIAVATNPNYLSQTLPPNYTKTEIGSFIVTNNGTDTVQINTLNVVLNFGNFIGLGSRNYETNPIGDLSALRTSVVSGSGTVGIMPAKLNQFSVAENIASGKSEEIDIFADLGPAYGTNATIQTVLTVDGTTANGQTITINQ